jgi:hypothetical protein
VFTFRRAADIDEKRPFLERRKIKQVEIRKNAAQIRQLAPTDEDQLAAGLLQQAQCLEVDPATMPSSASVPS